MAEEQASRSAIQVQEDGPYLVPADVALCRAAQVETSYGEPVGWTPDEPVPTRGPYELCRCGRSGNKPFCDNSHQREGFDGTETADRGPSADRRRSFVGDDVVMHDDRSLCEHAGFCGDRFTNVWRMIRSTDDAAVRERLIGMVRQCPAGALTYVTDEDDAPTEPVLEPGVAVVADGPLYLRGGIPVIAADGTPYEVRNRVTLCRCGRSRNKPFCDGTHRDVGFRDG